ncbi:toxin VasX, partial [Pseudomonas sp. NY15372]|uniref:toxin VasX n=1 Tax=Pseudomonas sp. NY15372 TaxID=3400356 RepID=UPI003A843FEE
MSISKSIIIAMRQAIPNPNGACNACERSGLPILLLRTAYAPRPRATTALPLARNTEVAAVPLHGDQPRILRQGYVYVLLDQEVWQAY